MQRIDRKSYATIEFTLVWESVEAKHVERFLARRVNMWRDAFPPRMEEALTGLAPGEGAIVRCEAGEAYPLRDERLVLDVPRSAFVGRSVEGRRIEPRLGRFFPRGLFSGLTGVFPQDVRPTRIAAFDQERMRIDLNHPMAGRSFTLAAKVLNVAPAEAEVGGRLSVWVEEICDYGPGMQARLPGVGTDFGKPIRLDEADDKLFYVAPRLVDHVDAQASEHLRLAYAERLAPGMRVLDLMSSAQSHLPRDMDLRVTGLGLNAEELAANSLLSERIVHDLNENPILPFEDAGFDAVVCSLSIEYLTRPELVLAECVRALRPGGRLLVGFSNRWFPTKVRTDWPDLHEFERLGLVLDLMLKTPRLGEAETLSVRNWWRPMDDRHIGKTFTSDPVYVAAARKS